MPYNVYIDSSGDTGTNYANGSSPAYVVAMLFTDESDYEHNLSVLYKIKKIMTTKPHVEIKYPTLRQHKYAKELHAELGKVKGFLCFQIIIKQKCGLTAFKGLSIEFMFGHAAYFDTLFEKKLSPNDIKTIYIDHYKRKEELLLTDIFKEYKLSDKVVFEDSKKIQFLQLSDFFAGAMRYFIEQNQHSLFKCNICMMKKINKEAYPLKRTCDKIVLKNPIPHIWEVRKFKHLIPLAKNLNNLTYTPEHLFDKYIFGGIMFMPLKIARNYKFIDCYL